MNARHDKIGIKHVIRLEWMDKTLDMILAGMSSKEIRKELDVFLSDKKQSGGTGERGKEAYRKAVTNLMLTWCTPEKELISFRDAILVLAKTTPASKRIPLHWAMISAAYPFWFGVAKQIGRLLNLQDQITKKQIIQRLKEQYGDRETISRFARYVIRSFVAWDILEDASIKGNYVQKKKISTNQKQAAILTESTLLSTTESSHALRNVMEASSLFAFDVSPITGDYLQRNCPRINVNQFSPGEEMISLF
ncbi:MAG: hypothetical protein HOC09_29210 [Deltaproteobacteria bacterium]|jgi:hypothetical protein|nr:hypothetical protein [Deltaproteobacteria bacterium]